MITDIGPMVVSFYTCFSCNIISLFMDGGGKSSQHNVEGLKGSTEHW